MCETSCSTVSMWDSPVYSTSAASATVDTLAESATRLEQQRMNQRFIAIFQKFVHRTSISENPFQKEIKLLRSQGLKPFDLSQIVSIARKESWKAHEIAQALHGFIIFDTKDDAAFFALLEKAKELIDTCTPKDIAYIFHAFERYTQDMDANQTISDQIISDFDKILLDQAERFIDTYDISDLTFIFVALARRAEDAAQKFTDKVFSKMKDLLLNPRIVFTTSELAHIFWAYPYLNKQDWRFVTSLIQRSKELAHTFLAKEISMVLLAYSKQTDVKDETIFQTFSLRIQEVISTFSPQAISNTLSAFSKAEGSYQELFQILAKQAIQVIHDFTPQGLATTLLAFSKHGPQDVVPLFLLSIIKCKEIIRDFNAQAVATTLLAFSNMQIIDHDLFSGLIKKAQDPKTFAKMEKQGIANILWACALADFQAPILDLFVMKVIKKILKQRFKASGANQLYFFVTNYKSKNPLFLKTQPLMLEKLKQEIRFSGSNSQRDLYFYLKPHLEKQGIPLEEEYLCKDLGLSLDMAIPSRKIAIEIDGPEHFFYDGSQLPADSALDRVKNKHGWTVLRYNLKTFDLKKMREEIIQVATSISPRNDDDFSSQESVSSESSETFSQTDECKTDSRKFWASSDESDSSPSTRQLGHKKTKPWSREQSFYELK